ncbi:hypothetical protein E2C01_036078 [Portunus trituberculatus]|uniref:SGNH hydrolase-type esterase domain-containing protein n=1 Tax=Portunus trituberculatus TaxID=210409 RepID=A0A5B7FAW1_PORTR|nr:hypothetical protein [Portunus trituberculatus]
MRRKILRVTQRVETENSFAVLEGVEEEKEEAGSDEVRRVEGSLPAGKIILIGDSQVRHLDAAFYDKDRRRTRVCLPGAVIERISAQLDTCLADGTKPIVFLSAGGNDICKVRSEELFRRFKEALAKIRNKDATPVVCDHCRSNGWAFIDNWDLFYGKDTLYARDGVHLSRQGVRVLAGTLEGELNALQRFFRRTGEGRGIGDP